MVDFDILAEAGTTKERLKEFFTAEAPSAAATAKLKATPEGRKTLKRIEDDVKKRKQFEERLSSRINEHVIYSLQNHALYSSVDIAWDSCPINRNTIPLMQYAQGRLNLAEAERALKDVPNGDSYLKKNDAGQAVGVDLPKFTEMNVNLIRSVITRRVAAQSERYRLWPHFKYESRDSTQIGRLRSDLTSQRMDIMADQFDYSNFEDQVRRDMLLYPNGSVAFPRASWEREVQWRKKKIAKEFQRDDKGGIVKEPVVVREGVAWVNPHPSRRFYDMNYPESSLNTDTGCEYCGFWDVARWGDIEGNPNYFNRESVSFSADTAAWFTTYSTYFNQYYDRIKPPCIPENTPSNNDRKNNVGLYSGEMKESGTFFTHFWVKEIPRNWGWGTYPYPVWFHLKVAGDATVVYADIMPSSPGAVFQFNCNDGRLNNISMAHELMQYQDQLTNLFSQLLETIKADLFSVAILNEDIFPETPDGQAVKAEFKKIMQGKAWFAQMQVLQTSFEKLSQLMGQQVSADMVFKVVRSNPNTAITEIFQAIASVISMAEKLMVLSASEQGQAASHEISATESNQISRSTDTVYGFISSAIDRGRAAMKRICYESLIACGSDQLVLPAAKRYPKNVVEKAGFTIISQDDEDVLPFIQVQGEKGALVHDYIFTSRDGADRPSNSQAATVLAQLLTSIGSLHPSAQTAILSAMGKEKLLELFNTIFRLADAGADLNLEIKPGEGDELLMEDDQQVMGIIQQLSQAVQQNTTDVAQLKQLAGAGAPAPQQ